MKRKRMERWYRKDTLIYYIHLPHTCINSLRLQENPTRARHSTSRTHQDLLLSDVAMLFPALLHLTHFFSQVKRGKFGKESGYWQSCELDCGEKSRNRNMAIWRREGICMFWTCWGRLGPHATFGITTVCRAVAGGVMSATTALFIRC